MIGEIGGSDEEEAALFVKKKMTKPVVGFIAGRTAPPGKRMGHAGAIISGSSGTAADKVTALNKVGIPVATSPLEVPKLMAEKIKEAKSKVKKTSSRKTVRKTTSKKASKKAVKKTTAKKGASKTKKTTTTKSSRKTKKR